MRRAPLLTGPRPHPVLQSFRGVVVTPARFAEGCMDLWWLALVAVFFLVARGFVSLCDRLH